MPNSRTSSQLARAFNGPFDARTVTSSNQDLLTAVGSSSATPGVYTLQVTSLARAEQLAPAIGVDANRLLDWCTAFAAMTALEVAEAADSSRERIQAALTLASQAPTGQA